MAWHFEVMIILYDFAETTLFTKGLLWFGRFPLVSLRKYVQALCTLPESRSTDEGSEGKRTWGFVVDCSVNLNLSYMLDNTVYKTIIH